VSLTELRGRTARDLQDAFAQLADRIEVRSAP
jgi:hypothetical protein